MGISNNIAFLYGGTIEFAPGPARGASGGNDSCMKLGEKVLWALVGTIICVPHIHIFVVFLIFSDLHIGYFGNVW